VAFVSCQRGLYFTYSRCMLIKQNKDSA
jgi:hypothetical protein